MTGHCSKQRHLRVATYNIHKCRGLDGRVRPERIVQVLREIDADIVGLQEVVSIADGLQSENQAAFIAHELGLEFRLGANRSHNGGDYGNVVLSKFPIQAERNYNLDVPGREPRGCLRVDIKPSDFMIMHVFNVHLGTSLKERRIQAKMETRQTRWSPDRVFPFAGT